MSYGILLTVSYKDTAVASQYIFHTDTKEQADSLINDTLSNARNMGASVEHVSVLHNGKVTMDSDIYDNRVAL